MNVYLTAFGFGDEDKKQATIRNQVVAEKTIDKKSENSSGNSNNTKTALNKTTDNSGKNNSTSSATVAKPKIELLPLKQKNISVYILNTKEYFNFGVGENNAYYSITHFTPNKNYDWFIFSNNINEKRRLYSSGKKGEKVLKDWFILM